jgi:hypothetical protein
MDLNQALRELRAHRDRLNATIEQLEELAASSDGSRPAGKRRGRKSMGEAERREVSERMKRYWASRRKARGASA